MVKPGQLGWSGHVAASYHVNEPAVPAGKRCFEQMSGSSCRLVPVLKGGLALRKLPSFPAGVCCLKHDIFGEFDELTDVARFHRHPRRKGPIVPSFIFFVEGALVSLLCMASHV